MASFRRMVAMGLGLLAMVAGSAPAEFTEGFGRFGRYNDDGLLTLDVWPDRMQVSSLQLRFASDGVTPTVSSINTSSKTLDLAGGVAGDATSVRYTVLYPGFSANFGNTARLRLSRSTVAVDALAGGLLLRPTTGSMAPVAIAFPDGMTPTWQLVPSGGSAELVLTHTEPIGELRFITPNGTRTFSSAASAGQIAALRTVAESWLARGLPVLEERAVDVDFEAATVTITETFSHANGNGIAPVPPVLAFAIANGYPATIGGDATLQRSGFITRYGEFAWVAGNKVSYTLPIPPTEERGIVRPLGRDSEIALLNDMTDRLGATWARNAVDLGYVGMTPAQMAWPFLNSGNRTALANAWSTYLPFAFRLPPYADADLRKTWVRETEPLSGLEFWYTYFITGGPGGAYKLDVEWGNLLPVYGLYKYAQFTGDWAFAAAQWDVVKQITDFTDYADDWAWMTNCNGDMGWSTGTGDPMTAAYVGHVAALKLARGLGDDARARHYAYRTARVAVPAVSRFWYNQWARAEGVIPANHVVQGFWEKSTFTSTAASQNTTDPWGPTNPLSGNGAQPEFFLALMEYVPDELQQYEEHVLAGYPNLFNGAYEYSINTTYGGNSVYVTFPHIYARTFLGEPTAALWQKVATTEANRRTASWIAPMVLNELLARDTPLILTEWKPAGWREGFMTSASRVVLDFQVAATPAPWTMTALLTGDQAVEQVEINGAAVPFTVDGKTLTVTATVAGTFQVAVIFEGGAGCIAEIIVDNETVGAFATTGPWTTSANPPLVGSTSIYAQGGGAASTATWTPQLECAGIYDVYATWVAASNRSNIAPYVVNHKDGSTSILVNQKVNGNSWNLLGRFEFDTTGGSVTLSDDGVPSPDLVSADAVRFVLIEETDERVASTWIMH